MVCGKCSGVCSNPKESVKCADCASEFHVTCSRIRSLAKFNRLTLQDVAAWRCDSCKLDMAPATCTPDSEASALMVLLKDIKSDMAKNNQESRDNFALLSKEVSSVNSTLRNLQEKLVLMEKENKDLKDQGEFLKNENIKLSGLVHDLRCEVSDLQQYSRSNNIEIKGVPVSTNENIYTVLKTVADALKVEYNGEDISIAHRLQQPKDRSQPPNIVAQFVSRYTRNRWLAAARKKHVKTTDLYKDFVPAPVYINEHLTAANKALLGKAKFLVKKRKLHAAWSRDGSIYVRKTAEARTQRVRRQTEACDIAGVAPTWTGDDAANTG